MYYYSFKSSFNSDAFVWSLRVVSCNARSSASGLVNLEEGEEEEEEEDRSDRVGLCDNL